MTPPPTELPPDKREGVRFTLKMGRALHIYGASATRLEAVMGVLSTELGLRGNFFSMPTALLASFELPGEEGFAHLYRLRRNEMDFDKLCRLDRLWNDVVAGIVTPEAGLLKIDQIDEDKPLYGPVLITTCFAISSAAASTFFGGGPREMILAGICGLVLGLFLLIAGTKQSLIGLHELLSAGLVSLTAVVGGYFLGGADVDTATLAGIIILLPGFTLTTAVSELAQRNVISGTGRLAWFSLVLMMPCLCAIAWSHLAALLVGPPPAGGVVRWPGRGSPRPPTPVA
ncbi:MAG: threonine/serine exporter family protein, partial [Planctomycetes bacterium]|nr:threonine/serine exporter family protein [Planctomycetota bacterium]